MLGPHTVTVIQPAERDTWGDTQSGDASTTVAGCFWQPRGSQEETTGGRDLVTADASLFMPPTADIRPTSRIVFDGVTYEVRGQPSLHRTPAGPHHYEVELVRVRGG
jgi:hypothetical protein